MSVKCVWVRLTLGGGAARKVGGGAVTGLDRQGKDFSLGPDKCSARLGKLWHKGFHPPGSRQGQDANPGLCDSLTGIRSAISIQK